MFSLTTKLIDGHVHHGGGGPGPHYNKYHYKILLYVMYPSSSTDTYLRHCRSLLFNMTEIERKVSASESVWTWR
jgi:hypothetical protein